MVPNQSLLKTRVPLLARPAVLAEKHCLTSKPWHPIPGYPQLFEKMTDCLVGRFAILEFFDTPFG